LIYNKLSDIRKGRTIKLYCQNYKPKDNQNKRKLIDDSYSFKKQYLNLQYKPTTSSSYTSWKGFAYLAFTGKQISLAARRIQWKFYRLSANYVIGSGMTLSLTVH
jgi:hypothetical protein